MMSVTPEVVAPAPDPEPVKAEPVGQGTKTRTVQQTLYLQPAVYEQLRSLAFHERTKMHTLALEGLDRVFADRGLKPISELGAK